MSAATSLRLRTLKNKPGREDRHNLASISRPWDASVCQPGGDLQSHREPPGGRLSDAGSRAAGWHLQTTGGGHEPSSTSGRLGSPGTLEQPATSPECGRRLLLLVGQPGVGDRKGSATLPVPTPSAPPTAVCPRPLPAAPDQVPCSQAPAPRRPERRGRLLRGAADTAGATMTLPRKRTRGRRGSRDAQRPVPATSPAEQQEQPREPQSSCSSFEKRL